MPTETRDHDPHWGRMFRSSAALEALREAAAEMQKQTAPAPQVRPAAAPAPKAVQPPVDDARILLDLIAQAEVKGHPVSYDVTFGFGKYDPPGYDKPITRMTLDEVDRFQAAMRAPNGSTPVGKYQFTRATLRDLRKQMGLSGSEVFTPELQERLGRKRLSWTLYDSYLAGEASEAEFRRRLNGAWASVPLPGDGSAHRQPLGITDAEVQAALRQIRDARRSTALQVPPADSP